MIYKLIPYLKSALWGGDNLSHWGKRGDNMPNVAESWELSFHPEGESMTLIDGYAKKLGEVVPSSAWGNACADYPVFPTLTKFIDAASALSVQVHPADSVNPLRYGKSEMWYILSCKPDACIYLGLNRDVTREEFEQALNGGDVTAYLNNIPVSSGQAYCIPAGTLHAIGGGITLYELQQNSNLTYRVYDYNRTDAKGNKRQLHVEQALSAMSYTAFDLAANVGDNALAGCKYFSSFICRSGVLFNADSYIGLTVFDGEGRLNDVAAVKGDSFFIPAATSVELHGNLTCFAFYTPTGKRFNG